MLNKKSIKFASYLVVSILLTLGLSVSLQSLLATWTAPTANPPSNNIAKPLNEGSDDQTKDGGLGIGSDLLVGIDAFYVNETTGRVGIGTTSPSAKLEVDGNIIADSPTAINHVATKEYVDAAGGGKRVYTYTTDFLGGNCNFSCNCPLGWSKIFGNKYNIFCTTEFACDCVCIED